MGTEHRPEAPAVTGVTRWRRKSPELEVTHWDGTAEDAARVIGWILASGGTARYHGDPASLSIDIPGGTVDALPGDRIVWCRDSSFRPLTEPDFLGLHEPVSVLVSDGSALADAQNAIGQVIRKLTSVLDDERTPPEVRELARSVLPDVAPWISVPSAGEVAGRG